MVTQVAVVIRSLPSEDLVQVKAELPLLPSPIRNRGKLGPEAYEINPFPPLTLSADADPIVAGGKNILVVGVGELHDGEGGRRTTSVRHPYPEG